MSGYTFEEVTTSKPLKRLTKSLKKTAGRGTRGNITCRHRGGGATKKYRNTDFRRTKNFGIAGTVSTVEYDPVRSAYIMLVTYKNGDKRYHLAPHGIQVGDEILMAEKTKIKVGNRLQVKHIPPGFDLYNLELQHDRGGQAVRSAGSAAKVLGHDGEMTQIQLPSKEVRLVPANCYATIGRVSNIEHNQITIGKAGRKRKMGRRPQVRGKAMNPNDHPHGGGEGGSPIGLKYPKTPWGLPALGKKTRKRKDTNRLILRTRKGKLNIK